MAECVTWKHKSLEEQQNWAWYIELDIASNGQGVGW